LQFLKDFLANTVAQNYTVEWKRTAFFRFVKLFPSPSISQELKSKVLQLILIPCFAVSFEKGETNKLVGGLPMPYQDNPDNVVSVFINKLIEPENPFPSADCVRIALLQFSCLLVEQASPHIHDHDANNKTQGFKLRRLMTFAWPCLLVENCVDPATRYHGHLLLSHIIDKFAIHRKIVLQVFHSLLKAHALEARNVVRQALEILTPSMPLRMDEGNTMLTHWTKKIIVDEGHSMQQLFHILQLVVKHYKVYYPVRHHLVQHMVNSIQRLGFSPTATLEHRKLAVELAEVIIKWELYGIKEDGETTEIVESTKRMTFDDQMEGQRKKVAMMQPSTSFGPVPVVKQEPGVNKPIDRAHTDTVLNFLLRLACQVNDSTPQNPGNPTASSPGELLSRRCVILLKTALKPDLWAQPVDLKLAFFDKILLTVEAPNPNIGNVCTALELLTYLLSVLKKDQILASFKPLQRGLGERLICNRAVVTVVLFSRSVYNILQQQDHQAGARIAHQTDVFVPYRTFQHYRLVQIRRTGDSLHDRGQSHLRRFEQLREERPSEFVQLVRNDDDLEGSVRQQPLVHRSVDHTLHEGVAQVGEGASATHFDGVRRK
jgi:transformation/transcription domain-associated protein